MNETIINGIDVSEYFIDVVDEGGSTIDYKILPNSERLLVEKIFEQNQQLKRLQEENKELKNRNANLRLNLATYDLPEVKKVLTDWRTGELDKKFKKLQKENEELKENKRRCAFKCLDNTFCNEAKIRIDKLELDKDCLNASLETARKYRGIAESDRDKYKQALENIREAILKNYTIDGEDIVNIINEALNE